MIRRSSRQPQAVARRMPRRRVDAMLETFDGTDIGASSFAIALIESHRMQSGMLQPVQLVLVEDNPLVVDEMCLLLRRQGYVVHDADCGEQLNDALRAHPIDIVILDVNLPHEDGFSIARRLRQSHPYIGIIMVTARGRHSDRSEGYQAGADVYMAKPVQPDELLAVLAKLTARLAPSRPSRFVLSRSRQQLMTDAGKSLDLSANEFLLLELLMLSPGQEADVEYLRFCLNRDGDGEMSRDSLYVLVSRLRTKVASSLGVASCLSAIRGYGYKLNIPLSAG